MLFHGSTPPISCETHMPRAVGAIFPHFIPLDVEHPTLLLWLGLGRPPYPLLVRIPHDIQFVPCQPGECSAAGEPFWAQIFRPVLQFGGQRWWKDKAGYVAIMILTYQTMKSLELKHSIH